VSESIRVAGDKMNFDIVGYLKRRHNLIVGERTAETIKIQIGSALPVDEPLTMEVRGRFGHYCWRNCDHCNPCNFRLSRIKSSHS